MAEGSIAILEQGEAAPGFSLTGTDGVSYSLDDFLDNTAILVVFTCNHCPYAVAKMPLLNDLAAEYDELAVVGINANANEDYPDDSFERMQELSENGTVKYDAYLFDESQEVAAAYGAVCTPDPFLFAVENGTTSLAYHGRLDDAPNPDDEPERIIIREAIESVLTGEAVTIEERPSRGCTIKWRDGNEPEYWDQV